MESTDNDKPLVPGKKPKHRVTKMTIILSLIVLAAFFIIAGSIFTIGLYRSHWESSFVQQVTEIIPYPAASVNGDVIRYSEYLKRLNTLVDAGVIDKDSAAYVDMKERVMENLIRDYILEQMAEDFEIVITADEVAEKITEQQNGPTGVEDFVAAAAKEYSWSEADYKNLVIVPLLRYQKLSEAVIADTEIQLERLEYTTRILERVHRGDDFSQVAQEVSQDPSALYGGDLGFVGQEDFDVDLAQAIYWLDEGGTTDIIDLGDAYYLYHVSEIVDTGSSEKRHVFVIMIKKKTVDDAYEGYFYNAEIKRYI